MRTFARIGVGLVLTAVLFGFPHRAVAHEQRAIGPLELTVGWENEPTYTGFVNAAGVTVRRGGSPVAGASLEVEVIFGERNATTKSQPKRMDPAFGEPGHYTAPVMPTRPGTYTFHVTGTAGGTRIDQYFTSGENTFDNVEDASAVQFPGRDPSLAQLGQRLDRADNRLAAAQSASSRSTIALVLGAGGVLVGLVALVLARR